MPDGVYRCFPFDSTFNWNVHDFGPLYIPRKGDRITVNQTNYKLYKQMIEWESKDSLSWKDKTENSRDSRYLGLIPEEFIVGVAWKVWKSVDPYTGEYRKGRFWKNIRNN